MSTPLLENIRSQPQALRMVAEYQAGVGRDALRRAAAALQAKRRIVLTGMGASFFALTPLAYALTRAGATVSAVESSELLYFLGGSIDSDTAVVLVSRSGESVEVTRLLAEAQSRGAAIVGVANVTASNLLARSDQPLFLNSPADQLVAIQTYVATLAVLELLAGAYAGEFENAMADFQQAIDTLSSWIPACVEARHELNSFTGGGAPLYILGRGPSLGNVAEGVLLMHETAKTPAAGMSSAQFRHGPVEVVDRQFRAVILATQRATAYLEAALAGDLKAMGGDVRWIGPFLQRSETPALFEWPDNLPGRFASLAEIVPLQLAAYQRAEMSGIRPGDFRWAPAVTTSETGFSLSVSK